MNNSDFDLSQFNELFLREFNSQFKCNFRSMHSFSNGQCMFYAYLLMNTIGGTAYSYTSKKRNDGHCFVKIGNKFYDSDSPKGVSSYKDLQPYLKRSRIKPKRHLNPNRLLTYWGDYSPCDVAAWDLIGNKIKEFTGIEILNDSSRNLKSSHYFQSIVD